MDDTEMLCTCGDSSAMHVDGTEQCFNGECGCSFFEPVDEE